MTTPLDDYHSCSFCCRFILGEENGPQPKTDNELFFFSSLTLFDIQSGASQGCEFFKWLISQWSYYYRDIYNSLLPQANDLYLYASTFSEAFVKPRPLDEVSFFALCYRNQSGEPDPQCLIRTSAAIVLTNDDDAASNDIWNRPIQSEMWSKENIQLSNSWINKCLTEHKDCPKLEYKFMPQRVIEVSRDRGCYKARLCMNPKPAPYVALSYCWGGDQLYKTTKDRMQAGILDLEWDLLPITLQDAIAVTIDTPFKYIWIDSFCIVQDDADDFAIQMADVPDIYKNAAITVMAARASSVLDGFLHDINLENNTLAVQLAIKCSAGQYGTAYITSINGISDPEPIDYRAWTMQELYLSPRVLYFGTRQLKWQCEGSRLSPGSKKALSYINGWRRGRNPEHTLLQGAWTASENLKLFKDKVRLGFHPDARVAYAVGIWHSLIPTYTRRTLGHATDRSWACSGLAQAMSSMIEDEYMAGHWKKSLPGSLLWHITTPQTQSVIDNVGPTPPLGPRLLEYLAPSWSWTSVLGCASFLYANSIAEHKAELKDVGVELYVSKARYGAVRNGSITIQGRMRDAMYCGFHDGKNYNVWLEKVPVHGYDSSFVITKIFPDALEPEFYSISGVSGSIHVYLLEIADCGPLEREWGERRNQGKNGLAGLVLREITQFGTAGYSTFKRLGMFYVDKNAIDEGTPEEKVEEELGWFDQCQQYVIRIE